VEHETGAATPPVRPVMRAKARSGREERAAMTRSQTKQTAWFCEKSRTRLSGVPLKRYLPLSQYCWSCRAKNPSACFHVIKAGIGLSSINPYGYAQQKNVVEAFMRFLPDDFRRRMARSRLSRFHRRRRRKPGRRRRNTVGSIAFTLAGHPPFLFRFLSAVAESAA